MKSPRFKYLLLIIVSFAAVYVAVAHPHKKAKIDHRFSVVAFGDMPYFLPDDYAKFENLLAFVNTRDQVFNVFVGDIKSSKTDCSNDVYLKQFDYFNRCEKPLVYTPGDNEWTDCKKPKKVFDPEERLDFLRSVFFKDQRSLGKEKMGLLSQSSYPGYSKYVENKRWSYKGITFATVHIVGSNNNMIPSDPKNNREFEERYKADSFWLHEVFMQAEKNNSPGIMLFEHADMFTEHEKSGGEGFTKILKELAALTKTYGKPVLLVNGDSHKFLVDKPFHTEEGKEETLLNFTRVQVFGEHDVHAVTIYVDPDDPLLFSVQQLLIPGNK